MYVSLTDAYSRRRRFARSMAGPCTSSRGVPIGGSFSTSAIHSLPPLAFQSFLKAVGQVACHRGIVGREAFDTGQEHFPTLVLIDVGQANLCRQAAQALVAQAAHALYGI